MPSIKISAGVVHAIPEDLACVLGNDSVMLDHWESITPLARNEWICWIDDAKKSETRQRRVARAVSDLKNGKRRPCCWPGCAHRARDGKA